MTGQHLDPLRSLQTPRVVPGHPSPSEDVLGVPRTQPRVPPWPLVCRPEPPSGYLPECLETPRIVSRHLGLSEDNPRAPLNLDRLTSSRLHTRS